VSTSPPPDGHQSKWNEQLSAVRTHRAALAGGGRTWLLPGRRLSGSGRGEPSSGLGRRDFDRRDQFRAHRGNPPEERVERLREFWETITTPPFGVPTLSGFEIKTTWCRLINQIRSLGQFTWWRTRLLQAARAAASPAQPRQRGRAQLL